MLPSILSEPLCLVCWKSIKEQLVTENIPKNSAQILYELLKLFCKFTAKLDLDDHNNISSSSGVSVGHNDSNSYSFDFTKEPFPFCTSCKLKLVQMFKLNEQVEALQNKIQALSSNLAATIIESSLLYGQNSSLDSPTSKKKSASVTQASKNINLSTGLITNVHQNVTYGESTVKKVMALRQHICKGFQVNVGLTRLKYRGEKEQVQTSPIKAETENPNSLLEKAKKHWDLITIPKFDVHNYDIEVEVETQSLNNSTKSNPADDDSCAKNQEKVHGDKEVVQFCTPEGDLDFEVPSPMECGGDPIQLDNNVVVVEHNSNQNDNDEKNENQESGCGQAKSLPGQINKARRSPIKKRSIPLYFNRTIEISPNKFVYGNQYRFEKLENGEYECEACQFRHVRKDKMVYHVRYSHCYVSRFTCEICGKLFSHNVNLKNHQATHVSELQQPGEENSTSLPHPCTKCGKSFKTVSAMNFHRTRHNCNNDYEYECDEPGCGKKIFSLGLLEEHKRVHSRPYKCHICSKAFGYRKGFQHHLRVHNGTQSHFCLEPGCERKFRRRYELQEHMMSVHQKTLPPRSFSKRPKESDSSSTPTLCASSSTMMFPGTGAVEEFRCKECGKVLPSQSSLETHEAKHKKFKVGDDGNGELKFKCDVCNKCFKGKKNLKDHQIIHSDHMPFSCQYCGKKTRKSRNLKSHIKSVHSDIAKIQMWYDEEDDEGDNPDECLPII